MLGKVCRVKFQWIAELPNYLWWLLESLSWDLFNNCWKLVWDLFSYTYITKKKLGFLCVCSLSPSMNSSLIRLCYLTFDSCLISFISLNFYTLFWLSSGEGFELCCICYNPQRCLIEIQFMGCGWEELSEARYVSVQQRRNMGKWKVNLSCLLKEWGDKRCVDGYDWMGIQHVGYSWSLMSVIGY